MRTGPLDHPKQRFQCSRKEHHNQKSMECTSRLNEMSFTMSYDRIDNLWVLTHLHVR